MKIVRRKLADGSVKEYRYQRRGPRIMAGSLGALIQEYRKTPAFNRLAPSTRKGYLRSMALMHKLYDAAVVDIKRRHVIKLRDAHAATPGIANQIIQVFSVLMNYAIDMEYRETNPAFRVERLSIGEYDRWSDEQIALALEVLPESYRRAVLLAVHTGQRQGDIVAMRWSDYDGEGISVVQQKTGAKLWIPCHEVLRAGIDAWKQDRHTITILANRRGQPYNAAHFSTMFTRLIRPYPELNGLVFHGLRKTAAAKLAEAGCSIHEIAAITGHQTIAMLQHYTKGAEQRSRASAAILKMEGGKREGKTGKNGA